MRFGQQLTPPQRGQSHWADLPPLSPVSESAPLSAAEDPFEGLWGDPAPSEAAADPLVTSAASGHSPAAPAPATPAAAPLSIPGRLRWQGETPRMSLEMSCAGAGRVAVRGEYDSYSAVCEIRELREAAERAISLHRSYRWWKRAAYQAKVTIGSDHGPVTVLAGSRSLCIKLPTTTGVTRGSKSYVVQTLIEVGREQLFQGLGEIQNQLHRQAAALIQPAAVLRVAEPESPSGVGSPSFSLPQGPPQKPTVAVIGSGLDGSYEICDRYSDGSLRLRRV